MWLLPTVVCCGLLTWASFLYIGVRAKRRSWLAAAALYGAVFVVYLVVVGTAPEGADGSPDMSGWLRTTATSCLLAVWIGGIVHALIVNRQWLALQASPKALASVAWSPSTSTPNPSMLDDPWRWFVSQAFALQRDIATAAINTRPGPMQDRLQAVADHVDAGRLEVWQVAQGGQRLTEARAHMDTAAISRQLSRLPTADQIGANPSLADVAQALQAQLDTATRLEEQISSTYNGLLLLNARLGEVAARVNELAAQPHAVQDAAAVDGDVESVVEELIAVRQALTELDDDPAGR
jgi:hypothetical protein